MRSKLVILAAGILPALAILALVELSLRTCGADAPHFHTTILTSGANVIHREDDLLFFSLRPNIDVDWQGVRNRTNSLGLRSPEVERRADGETRVLSLGESTTYGALVEGDQTYSARLEALLRERDPQRPYTVINAGVSAYSSFQSLLYLRERGFALEPDLVLFYHEINDYLPSSVRAAAHAGGGAGSERSLALSDIELYESRSFRLQRALLKHLALARVIASWRARSRLAGITTAQVFPHGAGLEVPKPFRNVQTREGIRRMNLPARVRPEQRVQILDELATLCEAHGITLVVIHPSYARSKRHECELTEFCVERGVTMVEAYEALHPPGIAGPRLFIDAYHPRAAGHEALAKLILDTLVREGLIPRPLLPEPRF